MKRLLAALLALVMVFGLTACAGKEPEKKPEKEPEKKDALSGTYWVYSMTGDGETLDYEMLCLVGLNDTSLVFGKDNKVTFRMAGEDPVELVYDSEAGTLTGEDGQSQLTKDGDRLKMRFDDVEMVFLKEGDSLLTAPPEQNEDPTEEPTDDPAEEPTDDPTEEPTDDPTEEPTDELPEDMPFLDGKYKVVLIGAVDSDLMQETEQDIWIRFYDDGTALMSIDDEWSDLEWVWDGETVIAENSLSTFVMADTQDGLLALYNDTLRFQMEWEEDDFFDGEWEGDMESCIKFAAGDWHGVGKFMFTDGEFSYLEDVRVQIIARMVMNEDGTGTPFLGLAIGGDEINDFQNLSVEYHCETEYWIENFRLSGQLLQQEIDSDVSNISTTQDQLSVWVSVDAGEQGCFTFAAELRHLGDNNWDREYSDLYLTEAEVAACQGMNIFEIADYLQINRDRLPETW